MEKFCLKWNDFQLNASNAFNKLRKDKDFLDVTLVREDGEHISAHKVILSASSDFFKDTLKKANHTNPMIFLSGFHSKILTAVLDYVYNGEVNIFQEEIDEFLKSAEKLKIDGLTNTIEEQQDSTFAGNELTEESYLKEEANSMTQFSQFHCKNKIMMQKCLVRGETKSTITMNILRVVKADGNVLLVGKLHHRR